MKAFKFLGRKTTMCVIWFLLTNLSEYITNKNHDPIYIMYSIGVLLYCLGAYDSE